MRSAGPLWLALLFSGIPLAPATAQGTTAFAQLATRLAAMSAVTGLEQQMADTLVQLLPNAQRDAVGNVFATTGTGTPRRLVACPIDEIGYVVGSITPEGYLTLRRAGGGRVSPLFDQQLEGQRVTVFGAHGPVPGVVGVRSIHLTNGRPLSRAPFALDDAYVDIGADTPDQVAALGIALLAPVTRAKDPTRYGQPLLAAPVAGRRAACAALLWAATQRPHVRGTVVLGFAVQSELRADVGLTALERRLGPFDDVLVVDGRPGVPGALVERGDTLALPTRYTGTFVETVSLDDAQRLADSLVSWMGGGR